jgi:hypothetical protein
MPNEMMNELFGKPEFHRTNEFEAWWAQSQWTAHPEYFAPCLNAWTNAMNLGIAKGILQEQDRIREIGESNDD